MKILHAFVGSCVESEYLKQFGNVTGIGIEPTFYSLTNVDNYIQADLRNTLPINETFDFGLFHPPCKKFSTAKNTSNSEYQNLIPRAKEIAQEYCNYWVIENVRNSPIGFNPDLRLNGSVFDLSIKYERVFWTNYDIQQPKIDEQYSYEYNIQELNKQQAKEIKDYDERYYVHDIVKNSLPRQYINYIFSHLPRFT